MGTVIYFDGPIRSVSSLAVLPAALAFMVVGEIEQ
jgi:hypothetical protein